MSLVGKKPVKLGDGVKAEIQGSLIIVKGPKGELTVKIPDEIKVELGTGEIIVTRKGEETVHKRLHGLTRTLIANAAQGVKDGFTESLEIQGVGFKAEVQKDTLVLQLGFSHPVNFPAPKGITFAMDKENKNVIVITGYDKHMVGETASRIRRLKKPEPYKGKGIRYLGEKVRRKAGKSAAK